jgi:hypothetical protein
VAIWSSASQKQTHIKKMDYKSIAAKIIELKNADLALREKLVLNGKLSESYNTEMKSPHNRQSW